MPAFTLEEILTATEAKAFKTDNRDFADVVTDTRKIEKGVLFVALKGERFNGEDFAAEALKRGAAGVIVGKDCSKENLEAAEKEQGTVLQAEDTLAAYQQVSLKAGESKTITIPLGRQSFEGWDVKTNTMRVVPGKYELMVGNSSSDTALQRLTVSIK